MIEKIVSGGQTGADRAGLDVALELGLAIGGWIPRGRRAEAGEVPRRYAGLREAESNSYAERTELNVRDSDATLVLAFGAPTGGSAITVQAAGAQGRPCLVVDLERDSVEEAIARVRHWLAETRPRVLNVAGPRASQQPEILQAAREILLGALRPGGD